jgi:hypothetical protein
MNKAVEPVPAAVDLQMDRRSLPSQPQSQGSQGESPPAAQAPGPDVESDIRLTIEPALHGLGYVYRITDRTSGMVLAELPREAVKAKGQEGAYTVGDIVDTKA